MTGTIVNGIEITDKICKLLDLWKKPENSIDQSLPQIYVNDLTKTIKFLIRHSDEFNDEVKKEIHQLMIGLIELSDDLDILN